MTIVKQLSELNHYAVHNQHDSKLLLQGMDGVSAQLSALRKSIEDSVEDTNVEGLDIASLHAFSGTVVSITYIMEDPQTERLAKQLKDQLIQAGWRLDHYGELRRKHQGEVSEDACRGCIAITSLNGADEAAQILAKSLEGRGIHVVPDKRKTSGSSFFGQPNPNSVDVVIYSKR